MSCTGACRHLGEVVFSHCVSLWQSDCPRKSQRSDPLSTRIWDFFFLTFPQQLQQVACAFRWCGPCKILGPRLEKAIAKQKGRVAMAKVDIDDHTDLAIEYGVTFLNQVSLNKCRS